MNKISLFLTIVSLALFSITAEARDIAEGSIMVLGDTSFEDSSFDTKSSGLNDQTDIIRVELPFSFLNRTIY